MRKISMLMIATVFLLLSSIHAQTTLNPGDLVIVTVNQDAPDNFDFIPLVDLQAGTVIKFTDNGLNTSNVLLATEGTLTWTAPADVAKGTVVSFSGTAGGDWVLTGTMALSNTGDNLLVYQGDAATPSFIYGIGWGKTNVWAFTGSNDSNIPAALSVAGKTIVTLGTSDNYQYNGPTTGTATQLLAMVAYASYWNVNDATAYPAYATAFTISATTVCTAPYALTATGMTASSANLGWSTFGTETAWNVEYGVTGFVQGAGTTVNVTANPYTLGSLTSNTTYQYYVQADCGGSTSTWAGPFSFTTLCAAVSTLPWVEGFETGYADAATVAGCWSQISTTGAASWKANSTATTYNRTPRTGTFNATLYYSNEDWLFYPFSLTAGTSYTFEMYARQDGSTTTNADITVSYGSNADVASMTNPIIATTGLTSGNYQLLSGAFTPATTGTYYIGIKGFINGTPYYISIDDIKLDLTPACVAPTALTATSITASGANLGWTAGGTETLWNVEYGVTGFVQGAGTTVTGVTNPYTVGGLTQNTTYQFYVQSDCGGSGTSTWAGPFSFTTPYSCPKPTVPTVTNITTTSADLGWTNGGSETEWIVYYKTAAATDYTEVTGVTTNPYTLGGLTSATSYIFKVKANCSVSDTSFVSVTQTFTTSCNAEVAPTAVQDFATFTGSAPQPICWSEATGVLGATTTLTTANSEWLNSTGFANSGTNVGVKTNLYSSGNEWIISQPIDLGATAGLYRVSYKYAVTSYNGTAAQTTLGTHKVNVIVSTDGGATWSNTNSIKEYTGAATYSNTGETENINLTGYSGVVKFAFVATTTSTSPDIDFHIDDFKVEAIPSCNAPSALTATAITSTNATLGWTAGGTETTWNVEYGVTGFTQGTGTVVPTTANTLALTTLAASTTYQFYVQADCGGSGTSTWAGPFSFTTACGAISVPWFEGFEAGYSNATAIAGCWSQISTTGSDVWEANNTETSYNRTPRTGSWNATLGYGNEDWLFNQFSLNAGTSYTFEMYARQDYATTVDANITVSYGSNADVASMTNPIIATTGITNGNYQKLSGTFTPATSGIYYIGIKGYMSSSPWYISIDDIKLDVSPVCLEPTALTTTSITASDATIGWTKGGTETAWNVEYGPVGFTQGTGTIVTSLVDTTYSIADLSAATSYSFYVQADCGIANGQSTWAGPYTFLTNCANATAFIENFDAVTTPALPVCWAKVGTNGSSYTQTSSVNSSPNTLYIYSGSAINQAVVSMPPVSNAGANTHWLRFKMRANSTVGGIIEIGYLTNPTDAASFVSVITKTASSLAYTEHYADLGVAPGANTILAFRHSGVPAYSVLIDDVNWEVKPSCIPPSNGATTALTTTTASLAWTAGGTETAWNVEYGVTGFTQGTGTTVAATTNSTTISGLTANTSYQFYIQANCGGTDGVSTWVGPYSFYTGYCIPAPTSVDNDGITNVTFSTVNNTITAIDETYGDYTAMVGDIQQSAVVPVDITYATGYTYDTKIWIDWNDDLDFNDAGEEVYTGTSLSTNPTTLNASFTVPATAPLGQHRMRIGGQDNGPATPCYSGTYGVFEDYTVNVISGTSVCNTPTALAASNIGETTADLDWTSPATNFNVRYRIVGAATWTNTTATTTTLSLSSLTANTQYEFEVQAVCSATAGDTSAWATAATFTTIAASACATPTALVATSITQTSATLGWTSTASNFNVRYRVVGAATWTATTASAVTLPLTSLTAGTQYEFQVQAICSATAGDTSNWTSTSNFTTVSNCGTPTALVATSITETSATLGWTSSAANFNVRYRTVGATTWTTANAATVSLPLSGLTANTQYEFQVKAVCSATAGDTSAWAAVATFTTLATPTCPAPTALVVSAINTAGANLNWTAGGTETAWNIRYKKVVDATYTNVNNTTTKPYVLTGLQASTAYVWNVQAICSGTLNSAWSVDNTFTTTVGIESNSLNGLSVYSYNNQINVINNGNILVKEVVIYDMIGQQVGAYAINSTDNILINSNLTIGNYVVKVITETKVGNYKLFIK